MEATPGKIRPTWDWEEKSGERTEGEARPLPVLPHVVMAMDQWLIGLLWRPQRIVGGGR
jgi:hypothetical protein